jgi:hypothetical protein
VAAIVARIAGFIGDLMMFGDPFTDTAFYAIWITLDLQPLKAGVVISQFVINVFGLISYHSIPPNQVKILQTVTCCQGIFTAGNIFVIPVVTTICYKSLSVAA